MPMVSISYSYHTLMYKEQRFIKNVYGTSFDISEIILRVKSFLFSENVYVNSTAAHKGHAAN